MNSGRRHGSVIDKSSDRTPRNIQITVASSIGWQNFESGSNDLLNSTSQPLRAGCLLEDLKKSFQPEIESQNRYNWSKMPDSRNKKLT